MPSVYGDTDADVTFGLARRARAGRLPDDPAPTARGTRAPRCDRRARRGASGLVREGHLRGRDGEGGLRRPDGRDQVASRRLRPRAERLRGGPPRRGARSIALPGDRTGRGDELRAALPALLRPRPRARRDPGRRAASRPNGARPRARLERLRLRALAHGGRLDPARLELAPALAGAGGLVRGARVERRGLALRRRPVPRIARAAGRLQRAPRVGDHDQSPRPDRRLRADAGRDRGALPARRRVARARLRALLAARARRTRGRPRAAATLPLRARTGPGDRRRRLRDPLRRDGRGEAGRAVLPHDPGQLARRVVGRDAHASDPVHQLRLRRRARERRRALQRRAAGASGRPRLGGRSARGTTAR